ncbi:MAG: hypothetical protein ACP5JP_08115 [bacterium]
MDKDSRFENYVEMRNEATLSILKALEDLFLKGVIIKIEIQRPQGPQDKDKDTE